MTRTFRRQGETDEDGARLPKFNARSVTYNADPTKVKKDGHGRGNWGKEGDEIDELQDQFNFHHTRRRSNSMSGTHLEEEKAAEYVA